MCVCVCLCFERVEGASLTYSGFSLNSARFDVRSWLFGRFTDKGNYYGSRTMHEALRMCWHGRLDVSHCATAGLDMCG